MIYVCEYDGSGDGQMLQKYASHLPLPLYNGAQEGRLWQKRRERILAWMLLEYALRYEHTAGLDAVQEHAAYAQKRVSSVSEHENGMKSFVERLAVQRTEHGKPYSSAYPEIHFNLSHCETACACITAAADAGIDIERKFSWKDNLARRVCHPQEAAILDRLPQEEREQQLRFLWSMKESFVKLDGHGLGYGMDRIDLSGILPVLIQQSSRSGRDADRGEFTIGKECQMAEGQEKSVCSLQTKSGIVSNGIRYLVGNSELYTLAVCGGDDLHGQAVPILILSESRLLQNLSAAPDAERKAAEYNRRQ